MAARKRPLDMIQARAKAVEFAGEWLKANTVAPEGVTLDNEQFDALMDTTMRALVQAYAAGYMEGWQ